MQIHDHSKKSLHTIIVFLTLWALTEVALFLAPSFVPEELYLKHYLSATAKQKTEEFINNQAATVPDKDMGWVNKKSFSAGNWVIDQWGARNHTEITLEKPENTYRTIILGSSLMNGNNIVDNQGTISAFLDQYLNSQSEAQTENQANSLQYETMNFATMMYGLDQVNVQLKQQIAQFNPNRIIIGLHENPAESLKSVYVPFRLPEEENMPYVKPHFEIDQGQLKFGQAPIELLKNLNYRALNFFKEHDHFYFNFYRFEHFGFMPVGDQISKLYYKAKNMVGYWQEKPEDFLLLRTLMADIQAYADKRNIKVTYVYLPTPRALNRGGIWGFIPDYYEQRLEWLKQPWSKTETAPLMFKPQSNNPEIIDVRAYFRQHSLSGDQIYSEDDFHFSKNGNAAIAKAIQDNINF